MSLNRNETKTPWLQIMKSIPALAIFFGHLASNWATYLFTTSMPTYMKEILKFDIQSVIYLKFFFTNLIVSIILSRILKLYFG